MHVVLVAIPPPRLVEMNALFEQIRLVPCATLGTLFVDIQDGTRLLAREVAKTSAEKWLADLVQGERGAQDVFIRMKNTLADPLRAAGDEVQRYRRAESDTTTSK